MLLRVAEAKMEVSRLRQELLKEQGQSTATAGGQKCSNEVAMARQRGDMGRSDRSHFLTKQ